MIRTGFALLLSLICGGAASSVLIAADGSWNVDADGLWNDSGNWSGATIADGVDATATFPNIITADRTVTTDDRTVGNISFEDSSHDLTITGNTLTMSVSSGNADINVSNSNRDLTITSILAGSDGISKSGPGTVVLDAPSTFTGNLTMMEGTVQYSNSSDANSFGDDANDIVFAADSTIYNANNSFTMAQGLVANTGVTATISGAFGEKTYVNGVVAGSGTFEIAGLSNGWQVYWNNTNNTFTGTIYIRGGSGTAKLYVNSMVDSTNPIELGRVGNSNGHAEFYYHSGATAPLVLNSRNFHLTSTTSRGSIYNNAPLANILTINTDLLVTDAGDKELRLRGNNAGENTFAGDIADEGASVITVSKYDNGTWKLSGENTYTGVTTINAGTLILSGEAALADTGTLNITTNGVLQLDSKEKIDTLQINGTPQVIGTWGSTSSGAENQNDTYFSGTEMLYVGVNFPAPRGTIFMIE